MPQGPNKTKTKNTTEVHNTEVRTRSPSGTWRCRQMHARNSLSQGGGESGQTPGSGGGCVWALSPHFPSVGSAAPPTPAAPL